MLFDYVETLEGAYWLYQLTLLSPTKLLENVIINGMAETYCPENNLSLKEQIERVITKINMTKYYEKDNNLGRVSITYDANAFLPLYDKPSNDFLWSGQQTAREILQDICDKADYLIVGTDFTISYNTISEIKVAIEKREKQMNEICSGDSIEGGGLNAIKDVVKGITINRDSEYSNGNIISLIHNAVCKDNVQSAYMKARNDDLTIDKAETWHILTQEPIYTLNNVVAMMPTTNIQVYYWNYNSTTQQWETLHYHDDYSNPTMQLFIPIDITNYVVEKDVFDAMPISEQAKHFYFKRGEKGIYGVYDRYKSGLTGLFSDTAIKKIMETIGDNIPALTMSNNEGVIDWSSFNTDLLYGRDWLQSSDWTDVHKITNLKINTTKQNGAIRYLVIATGAHAFVSEENAYKECLFSVNYQPYCDSVVKIERTTELDNNVKNLSILKNQSDRTIDASKYYDSQKALVNRLGQEEMYLDCIFDLSIKRAYNLTNKTVLLYNLGDYITLDSKKWTCVKREIENYGNNKLKCRMTFSKNYNASNSAINVNRDKRLYGIPLNQYVDRYILFHPTIDRTYTKLLVESWDDFTGNTTTQGWCLLDFIFIGNSSQIDKVARCKDNYACDIERTKYSSTIVNVNVRYCDTTGFKDTIELRLLNDSEYNAMTISDYSRLPFIAGSTNAGWTFTLSNIYKDKMERLIFILI